MERLTHERTNGIKTGYWSPNKKQELVGTLAAYENTELTPEQIIEMDKMYTELAKEVMQLRKKFNNDGWIPVEKRLPEDDSMVLVTCQTKKGIRSVNRAYCDGAFWHGNGSMSGVIAWQPLPEPYQPERSEGE